MEKLSGGSYIQAVYDPRGDELALMFNGTVLAEARTPLVDGSAVRYTSGGLDSYFHPDWLGSTRFKSTPARTVKDDVAFAPFGEQYVTSGPVDSFFTVAPHDMEVDLRDFPAREYHTTQGRWLTPDPAGLEAVDLTNPQTLNRYAYVMNNPLANVDPTGMDACFTYYTVNNGDGPTFIASTTCYTTIPAGQDPRQLTDGNRGGTQTGGSGPGQPKKSGTQPCVAPNLLQRAGIAVQGLIARISGTAIGFGVGGLSLLATELAFLFPSHVSWWFCQMGKRHLPLPSHYLAVLHSTLLSLRELARMVVYNSACRRLAPSAISAVLQLITVMVGAPAWPVVLTSPLAADRRASESGNLI